MRHFSKWAVCLKVPARLALQRDREREWVRGGQTRIYSSCVADTKYAFSPAADGRTDLRTDILEGGEKMKWACWTKKDWRFKLRPYQLTADREFLSTPSTKSLKMLGCSLISHRLSISAEVEAYLKTVGSRIAFLRNKRRRRRPR